MCAEIPAWALDAEAAERNRVRTPWPHAVSREWAWGGSDGTGVARLPRRQRRRRGPPARGRHRARRSSRSPARTGSIAIADDDAGDVSGHGTACAGIIRTLAPGAAITSVRVLGPDITGTADDLLAGLEWAIEQRFDVISMSLSTRKRAIVPDLYRLADEAYFADSLLVACAHNLPVESFPWRFASVLSVAGHAGSDPFEIHCNATPARRVLRPRRRRGGGVERAAPRSPPRGTRSPRRTWPRVCARIRGAHPGLTPFQVKQLLYLTATNVEVAA